MKCWINKIVVSLSFLFMAFNAIGQKGLIDRYMDTLSNEQGLSQLEYLVKKMAYINDRYPDTLLFFSRNAANDEVLSQNKKAIGLVELIEANYWACKGDFEKALPKIKNAIVYFNQEKDSLHLAYALREQAYSYRMVGELKWAIESNELALQLLKNKPNKEVKLQVKSSLASYNLTFNPDKSKSICLSIIKEAGDQFLLSKAIAYKLLGSPFGLYEKDSISYYLNEAKKIYHELGSETGVASVLVDESFVLIRQENYLTALDTLSKAIELQKANEDWSALAYAYQLKTKVEMRLNQFDKATQSCRLTDSLVRAMSIREYIPNVQLIFMELMYRQEKHQEALNYALEYSKVKDSISKENNAKHLNVMQSRFELREKQAEIHQLEERAAYERNEKIAISISALLLLLIAALWMVYRRKLHSKAILLEQKEKNLLKLEKEKLETESKFRKQALVDKSLQLAEKNAFVEELKDLIKALKKSNPELNATELSRLNSLIKVNEKEVDEWLAFKKIFKQLDPGFLKKFKEDFADISSSDERLIALIRLNYNSKECAQLMHISPNSIKTARYRLKRKLLLGAEDSLDYFIQNMQV